MAAALRFPGGGQCFPQLTFPLQSLAFLLLANGPSEFRMYSLQFARRFSYALMWGTIVAAVLLAVTG
ncbi:MAG: hypothetical protein DYG96_02005 [Chlorobi bacterium CHB2]|nr:hypothetical protein [Chlorobi bacterium CHB2]